MIAAEIFDYADSKTKTVRLPDDLSKVLAKNKKAHKNFELLAYSNKREYVEWIISAKRDETRQVRLQSTIEKLLLGKKNPSEK